MSNSRLRHGDEARKLIHSALASEENLADWVEIWQQDSSACEARLMDLRARGASHAEVEELRCAICDCAKAGQLHRLRTVENFDPLQLHDVGNGQRLVRRHGAELRFVSKWRRWLVWSGVQWSVDDTGEVERRWKDTAAAIYEDAAALTREGRTELAATFAQHAKRSNSSCAITAALRCAESEQGVSIRHDELDANPYQFNVLNGTLDLETGELRPHRPENLITKLASVTYDPAAKCPAFEKFMLEIMLGRSALVEFLQRYLGMCMSGLTRDQVFCVLHGGGANGKSTLLEIMRKVFGDYAMQASTDLLLATSIGSGRHPTELTDLFGMRLVVANESDQGREFSEARVKLLTGGDRVRARRMREDSWEFKPTWKLVLAANHRPVVRGTDPGIWRRIRLVPFDVRAVDPAEEKPSPPSTIARDDRLLDRLSLESSGILNWLIRGCLEWQVHGLATPSEVTDATIGYRHEQDIVQLFLDERCVCRKSCSVKVGSLYEEYRRWAEASGERPVSKRLIGEKLIERGFTQTRTGHQGDRVWTGLGLADADVADIPDVNSSRSGLKRSHVALMQDSSSATSATVPSVSCDVCGDFDCDH